MRCNIARAGRASRLQSKTAAASASQAVTVVPDAGYDGLEKVTVEQVRLQYKTAQLGQAAQTVQPDNGYEGLRQVVVPNSTLQNKVVTLTNAQQIITADSGFYGLGSVKVPAMAGSDTYEVHTVAGSGGRRLKVPFDGDNDSVKGIILSTQSRTDEQEGTFIVGYVYLRDIPDYQITYFQEDDGGISKRNLCVSWDVENKKLTVTILTSADYYFHLDVTYQVIVLR